MMKQFKVSYLIQTSSTYGKYNYDGVRVIEAESEKEATEKLKADIAAKTSRKRYKVIVRSTMEI